MVRTVHTKDLWCCSLVTCDVIVSMYCDPDCQAVGVRKELNLN